MLNHLRVVSVTSQPHRQWSPQRSHVRGAILPGSLNKDDLDDLIQDPSGQELGFCCSVAKSCLTLLWPPWTVACQAPLSTALPRQEYWNGFPFPSPVDLPDLEIKPVSPAFIGEFFTTEPPGKLRLGARHSVEKLDTPKLFPMGEARKYGISKMWISNSPSGACP